MDHYVSIEKNRFIKKKYIISNKMKKDCDCDNDNNTNKMNYLLLAGIAIVIYLVYTKKC